MSRPLQPPELYVRAENGRVVFELRDNGITLTADEAQRALGAIVDRLRGGPEDTDCGSVDGEIK